MATVVLTTRLMNVSIEARLASKFAAWANKAVHRSCSKSSCSFLQKPEDDLRLSGLRFFHRIHDEVETKFVVMFSVNSVARRRIKHNFEIMLGLLQGMDELNRIFGMHVVVLQAMQD